MRHLQTFRLIEAVVRTGSIRKAAEEMHLTASALNRRIQRFEEEFGSQVFERLPRGMRLNPAGELLIQHVRQQEAELAAVRSRVADLTGERLGHVGIACSQALMPFFLPAEIARYRHAHPGVGFTVDVRDRVAAEQALQRFECDIALVFEPVNLIRFEVLHAVPQRVHAVFASDHPLAANDDAADVRLRDCLGWPCLLPSARYGVRCLLERALHESRHGRGAVLESDSFDFMRHYVRHERAVAFQIPIGLDTSAGDIVSRPLAARDVAAGELLLGRLSGRTLPVAAARFAQQAADALDRASASGDAGLRGGP